MVIGSERERYRWGCVRVNIELNIQHMERFFFWFFFFWQGRECRGMMDGVHFIRCSLRHFAAF